MRLPYSRVGHTIDLYKYGKVYLSKQIKDCRIKANSFLALLEIEETWL